jgi:mRNA-degrading endonuclease RelE of RelBE toxin-antitoxin system
MARFRLKFDPNFEKEMMDAIQYYGDISDALAKRFKKAIMKQFNLIRRTPFAKSIRNNDIRLARVEKFPYAIYYSIVVEESQVHVHAILSDYQDVGKFLGDKWD